MTFTDFRLHVAAVDHETVGVRATWVSRTAPTSVSCAVLGASSSGVELFDAVFSGSVGELWRTALNSIAGSSHRLAVRAEIAGTELEELPWEGMYDRTAELFLAASNRTTFVRLVPSLRAALPLDLDRPFTVVAMVNEGHAAAVSRWTTLEKSLRVPATQRVVLQRAAPVTYEDLKFHLQLLRVNVLHLIEVEREVVGRLPAEHADLRVVVLDGSHGAAVDLVSAGVSAVVSIPASMTGDAAEAFLRTFYSGLAAAQPVELVMSQARRAASRADVGQAATPALWMSHPWAALFTEPSVPLSLGVASPRPRARSDTPLPAQSATAPPAVHDVAPPPTSYAPPQHVHAEPPPPPRSVRGGSFWRSVGEAVGGLFSRGPSPSVPPRPGSAPVPSGTRTAYPRIDVQARRSTRRDVVLVDEPFDVVVGLGRYQDVELAQTGALRIAASGRTDLELVLTFDPTSLMAHGATRLSIAVTDTDPFPSQRVAFTALYRPDLPRVRRIGVHYLRDGQVVGIAWRSFVVVLDSSDIAGAPAPAFESNPMLDLEPLVDEDLPDLVLSVCASDGPATGEFVWTAYARSTVVVVPDGPRISRLDNDVQQFVAGMRDTVAFSTDRYAQYLALVGKATKLGRAMPESVVSMVRGIVEDRARREAATVLLLTEEVGLPWELAVFDPPLDSPWGGVAPFLGAHAAVSRWPLTSRRPRPSPRSSVTVRRAAVLTADYSGVVGVARLDHAQAEAKQVAALFAPPAVTVAPSLRDVVGMLRGVPPADVLHVALHGRFDATGSDEGLVLVATETVGSPVRTALFLTPDQVETGRLDGGPFVFLNACQVASDKRVLADYAGFASTLLRIGATGVVAPLWNVDDDVAATFAQDFYAATWSGGASATVAEAVRVQRARYTEAAAESHTAGITPTLIAFQVFGHPRLRLTHV